jgi:dihydroorotase
MRASQPAAFDLVLRGGFVVGPQRQVEADVAILDGRIAALVDRGALALGRAELDVTGRLLLPGLVDAHVHLREPGMTHKEDFVSGTRAAAGGGVTTLLVMPTDDPWTASPAHLAEKIALAEDRLHVDVAFQVAVPVVQAEVAELRDAGAVSFEIFTADVPDEFLHDTLDRLARAIGALAPLGLVLGVSPGDQSLIVSAAHADLPDPGGTEGFLLSRPPLAEANGIARAILCAAGTGARIHIRQINSALGVETLRRLKSLADVSVETTPQNLLFTADDYHRLGAALKGSPPLRAEADRQALLAALRDGLIDIVATDHAPHTEAEKNQSYPSFADIPGGFAGLQTLLPCLLHLVARNEITLSDLVRLSSFNPATRFGLGDRKGSIAIGRDADIVILDPSRSSTIADRDQLSKAGTTPFAGLGIPYTIERVLKSGVVIYADGAVARQPTGRVIAPRRAAVG